MIIAVNVKGLIAGVTVAEGSLGYDSTAVFFFKLLKSFRWRLAAQQADLTSLVGTHGLEALGPYCEICLLKERILWLLIIIIS